MRIPIELLLTPLFAATSMAQAWNETGDAGSLPRTAQAVLGSGILTSISGTLTNDVDMYVIQIDNPAIFLASTTGSALADTQLFLFDSDGRAVMGCDDQSSSNFQSTIPVGSVKYPGRYCLAVSPYDIDPLTIAGRMWLNGTVGAYAANGPGRLEEVSGWTGSGPSGSYTIYLSGCSFANRMAEVPPNCNLSLSDAVWASGGDDVWGMPRRFQAIYDVATLAAAGVTGPVTIDRLLFRLLDGVVDAGGISWPNVVVIVGSTSLTPTTMDTTFANNLAGAMTSIASPRVMTVTSKASAGTMPNTFSIMVDLAGTGPAFTHDPTGPRPNLLVDILIPTAPTVPANAGQWSQVCTNHQSQSLNGVGAYATQGSFRDNVPVMGLQFSPSATCGDSVIVPARNEFLGAACGGDARAFYQLFLNGQRFDLRGLRLTPNNPTAPASYTVTAIDTPPDLTRLNAQPTSTALRASVPYTLPFTFNFPSGATTHISATSTGTVWLGNASTTPLPNTRGDILSGANQGIARLLPFWWDFTTGMNTAAVPNAGLHIKTDVVSGHHACFVTWNSVGGNLLPGIPGIWVFTMQCVLFDDGVVEYRYGSMPRSTVSWFTDIGAVVGFVPNNGFPLPDPQPRDLSVEVPFTTGVGDTVGNLGVFAVTTPNGGAADYGGRLFAGQTVTWGVSGIPAGAVLGVQLVDIAATRPGIQMPGITAPNCRINTTLDTLLWEVDALPGGAVNGTVPFHVPAGYEGFELYSQYVVLNGLFGAADLVTSASNTIRHVVGRR